MAEQSHLARFAEFVIGDDSSELGIARAERDYALHCLEREIAICARTHAAFLAYLQTENNCTRTGQPCREHQKCGCDLEAREYIDAHPPQEREEGTAQ
ncbi:hypothetical protein LMTR13_11255 [Bradyrhizobium icense]|uniref:Uncharacterized protein n=1 Tax=Bradyrhizobium icense TaxID=1274631 RepID=A0A1B1UDA5_9BRAD|nr:hypothetical protein LMTR13_11255 [Bradyrhizobium icense]